MPWERLKKRQKDKKKKKKRSNEGGPLNFSYLKGCHVEGGEGHFCVVPRGTTEIYWCKLLVHEENNLSTKNNQLNTKNNLRAGSDQNNVDGLEIFQHRLDIHFLKEF